MQTKYLFNVNIQDIIEKMRQIPEEQSNAPIVAEYASEVAKRLQVAYDAAWNHPWLSDDESNDENQLLRKENLYNATTTLHQCIQDFESIVLNMNDGQSAEPYTDFYCALSSYINDTFTVCNELLNPFDISMEHRYFIHIQNY